MRLRRGGGFGVCEARGETIAAPSPGAGVSSRSAEGAIRSGVTPAWASSSRRRGLALAKGSSRARIEGASSVMRGGAPAPVGRPGTKPTAEGLSGRRRGCDSWPSNRMRTPTIRIQAETFDETNLTEDGEDIARLDMMRNVYDVTTADGDADDDEFEDEGDDDFDPDALDRSGLRETLLEEDDGIDDDDGPSSPAIRAIWSRSTTAARPTSKARRSPPDLTTRISTRPPATPAATAAGISGSRGLSGRAMRPGPIRARIDAGAICSLRLNVRAWSLGWLPI